MSLSPFTSTFEVRHIESGVNGRLTAPAFLDLFQEMAGLHAARLGFSVADLAERGLTWVLLRLFVRFDAPLPLLGETFSLTTWPSGHDGISAWRDATASDATGRPLARITTRWILIDLARRRPVRLPEDLYGHERPDLGQMTLSKTAPVAPAAATAQVQVHVRRSDLDANRHANNARYVEWALEPFPDAFLDTHTLTTLDVLWKAETFRGDALTATVGPDGSDDPLAFAHTVVRPDGKTSVFVRTEWTEDAPDEA